MNPKDWIDLLQRLFAWFSERRNPVRQQAARVLSTFEAHGVTWPGAEQRRRLIAPFALT